MTEDNLTRRVVDSDDGLRGCVLLVEPQTAHEEFLDGNDEVDYVIVKLYHAQTLVNRGETAESYFGPDVTVIVTSTFHDSRLRNWGWEEERDVALEFQPDLHIPTDYPVYWGYTPSQQLKNTKKCMKGLLWMVQELCGTETTVLPILKGTTPEERKICYKVFEHLGVDYCAFYGTQYFTSGKGFGMLRRDITTIVSEAPGLDLFVIGCLSPDNIHELPTQVVATSGLYQWRTAVELRDVSIQRSQELFAPFKDRVEEAFESGQAPLGLWTRDALMGDMVHG